MAENLKEILTEGWRGIRGVRQLKELLAGVTLRAGNDVVFWRWHDKELFTVKSTYSIISDGGIRDSNAWTLWSLRMPLRVQILIWLILKLCLLTTDILAVRGWAGNTLCVLCGCVDETIDYFFVRSVYSQFVMRMSNGAIWPQEVGEDVRMVWERLMTLEGDTVRAKQLFFLLTSWSVIWTIRNKVVFD